jgi:hypothetical protein
MFCLAVVTGMRTIKISILLSLSFVCVLLAARFFFLDQIVIYSLEKTGAKAVSIHISEIDWNQAHIDMLEATYLLPGGDTYSVRLRDISFYFGLPKLLTGGKNRRIDIEQCTIHRIRSTEKTDISFVLPDQIELLTDELRAKLPLEDFTVKRLRLQGDFPLQLIDRPMQVTASLENTGIHAEISMNVAIDTGITIDLQSLDSLHGDVKVVFQRGDKNGLALHVLLVPGKLSGNMELKVEPLRDFLLESGVLTEFPESHASVLANLEISLSNNSEKPFLIHATATDPSFPGLKASKMQLQLFGRIVGDTLLFEKESFFQVDDLSSGKSGFAKLFAHLGGSFSKKNELFLLELLDQQKLQISGLVTEKAKIPELNLYLEKPVQLFFQRNDITLTASALHFDPMQILEGERIYDIGRSSCSGFYLNKSIVGLALQTDFTLSTLAINTKGQQLPLKELSGIIQLKENRFSGKMQLSPEIFPTRFLVDFSHDLTTSSGNVQIKTDRAINLDGDGDSLADLLTSWSHPFNLDGGKVVFQADGEWQPDEKPRLSAFVSVTGGRGYYKKMLFNGLDMKQDLGLLPQLYSRNKGSFSLGQLTGGIDIFDIKTEVELLPVESGPLPQVQLKNLSAALFYGVVSSEKVYYDLNMPDSKFSVEIESLNLGKLVGLIKMDALYATGAVSGSIPVAIKGKDVSVDAGILHSDEPGGEIRYTPGNMNQSGLTGYALKAVEDLQYQTLQVTANYSPSGQLGLAIGLKGVSSGLGTTRPVHLKINVEQNLPALMQSLRFSKGLTEELDKRVKQHYN